ncbi:MAG: T9SS type A sorting domain-containing protein [Bacteroidia bacterium]
MMNKLLLSIVLLFVLFLSASNVNAQCPGCLIDSTQIAVGIYPDTLPDGTKNQPYDENITFVMFTDTLALQVYTFQIISVSGLPAGLSWECNNAVSGCTYDPLVNLYGCVKICGTPLQAGSFNMNVTVIADIAIVGPQLVSFVRPFTVTQGSSSNGGFSTAPSSTCPNSAVQFTSIIPALNYTWDFSNGLIDSIPDPATSFANPGDYVITQNALLGYNLDSLTISSVPYNYFSDSSAGNDPIPDIYFTVFDSAGTNIFNSVTATDASLPLLFDSITLLLTNQNYTIKVYDYDLFLGPDTLGQVTFNGTTLTGTLIDSIAGVSDSLTLSWWLSPVIVVNTDTVHIFTPPAPPVINSSGNDSLCAGDSVQLSIPFIAGNIVQWYNDTVILIGSNDTALWVSQSGNYWANEQDTNGCAASSNPYQFTLVPLPPKPNFAVNGNTLTCFVTGYNLQWYVNGIPIAGADTNVWTAVTPGYYQVIACNDFGCCNVSDSVLLTGVGIIVCNPDPLFVTLRPNPASSHFDINYVSKYDLKAEMKIRDGNSRIVFEESFELKQGSNTKRINCNHLTNGVYTVEMKNENTTIVNKLVIEK